MDFQTAYGAKVKHGLDCSDRPSMTKQMHRDECNINTIIKKYKTTGVITNVNNLEAKYGDVTGLDFQTAMDLVAEAQTMFQELPSAVRNKFKNDPGLFLDFMDNPANQEEMVSMGLATRREVEQAPDDPPKSVRDDEPETVEEDPA